jgi:hypothetical protein
MLKYPTKKPVKLITVKLLQNQTETLISQEVIVKNNTEKLTARIKVLESRLDLLKVDVDKKVVDTKVVDTKVVA